jgi:hypothetical protein
MNISRNELKNKSLSTDEMSVADDACLNAFEVMEAVDSNYSQVSTVQYGNGQVRNTQASNIEVINNEATNSRGDSSSTLLESLSQLTSYSQMALNSRAHLGSSCNTLACGSLNTMPKSRSTLKSSETALKIKELEDSMGAGNISPRFWYHRILRAGRKADTIGIAILSELVFLYRRTGETEFDFGYQYFKRQLNLTQVQTYEALVRLEARGFVKRGTKLAVIYGRAIGTELLIILNVDAVIKLNESDPSSGKKISQKYTNRLNPRLAISSDKYKSLKNKKSRSTSQAMESSFCEVSEEEEKEGREEKEENSIEEPEALEAPKATTEPSLCFEETNKSIATESVGYKDKQNNRFRPVRKSLSAYHPLSEDDVTLVNRMAGIDYMQYFSRNFVNQLMLKLDEKKPENGFWNKKSVLDYMAKALAGEQRKACQVNNVGFKFKAKGDVAEQERYLREVEDNRDTSLLSQLRRKIAARFDRALSYQLLKSCYFPDIAYRGVFDDFDGADGFIYKITMNRAIELTGHQRSMLLEEVRSVYGYRVESLEFVQNKTLGRNANVISTNQAQTQTQDLKSAIPASLQPVFVERNSIWHNIREDLKRAYGEGIFISWFGKLEPEEDKETKQLTLKAPTGFIADWIKDKYQSVIEAYCQMEQYELAGIVAR